MGKHGAVEKTVAAIDDRGYRTMILIEFASFSGQPRVF
jgi:hypothetical protein